MIRSLALPPDVRHEMKTQLRELCICLCGEDGRLRRQVESLALGPDDLRQLCDRLASQGGETVVDGKCLLVEAFTDRHLLAIALAKRLEPPSELLAELETLIVG